MKGKLTSKKSLEFLTIMTTVIGTMVGAGIYVKNDNGNGHVLGEVQNPFAALIAWGIIGIVVMAAIMIFMEIASATAKKGNGTVSNWIRIFLNRRTASLVSIYYIFIYLPVNYGFFSTLVIQYILTAAGNPITNKGILTAMYLGFGALFIFCFSYVNSYKRGNGKYIQIIGTIVKFIPLILVLLAIFIPDTTWAVLFNNTGSIIDENGNQIKNCWSTSFENIDGMKMLSGFTPILFAFNGFIYAANMQAETEHKDVVTKGILFGVLFTTIFYILISLSLFLGSADGSVVGFFDYMFNGFHTNSAIGSDGIAHPQITHHGISTVLSNAILAFVCLLGLNSYTLTGANFFNTDANNGILFSNNKYIKQSKSGIIQMTLGLIALVILVTLGIFNGHELAPSYYMDLAGNAGAILGFTWYTILILLAIINRFNKKVEVDRINKWVFWTCAPFSFLALVFICIYSYLNFFGAFGKSWDTNQIESVIVMGVTLFLMFSLWLVNEILFKWKPFNLTQIEKQKDLIINSQNDKIKSKDLYIKIKK